MWPQTWSMWTLTRTTTEDSWVPWVVTVFLVRWMIPCARTVAQVCALFVSSSSPCLMRTLSDFLSDLSIYLTFLHFITFSFLHFLLPFTFLFLDVVLTSTKRCLHEIVYTEHLEANNSGPCLIGSIRNGNRHRVLPPLGGNGVDLGGLPKNSKKVDERGCVQRFMMERGSPLCSIFG